jgi:hypothetical protein
MAEGGDGEHVTRAFAVGALEFAVATSTAEDQRLVERLYADVPAAPSVNGNTVILKLLRHSGGAWEFDGPNLGSVTTPTLGGALSLFVSEVNQCALDEDPDHLHLHGAVATKGGRAVVIAASANAGKTTTVAHLVARGWGYVTDESVRLSQQTAIVSGFPKPVSIKPGGHAQVPHLERWLIPPRGESEGADQFRFVAMGATGAEIVTAGVPHLLVLLRRPFEGEAPTGLAVHDVHPADAVVALMQETFDAERFGSAALQLATLAASSHCCQIRIGTPVETADAIETLFQRDPPDAVDVRVLPSTDAFDSGVVTVAIGDRIVVHDTTTGVIFALDPGGARVWRKLGGWVVDDELDLDGPVIQPFVGKLQSLGVLRSIRS